MNDTDEKLDNGLLKSLEANNTQFGLAAQALGLIVRTEWGLPATEEQVTERLEYLADKGLAAEVRRVLHKANRVWKITDAGRRYVDEQNL
jgi:hypothetical protein